MHKCLLQCVLVAVVTLHTAPAMIIEHNHSDERKPSGYDYIKNIKAAIEFDLRDKRVVKCYQCVYSPPHVETKTVARRRADGETVLVNVTREIQGGWAPCKGPFSRAQARRDGIDAGHCLSNCYTRLDHLGNMLRGCYRGEYGVNPNKTGCHQQAGYIYCFCEGDRCNSHLPSSLPETEEDEHPPVVRRVHKVYDEPYERGRAHHKSTYSNPDRSIYKLRYRDRETGPDTRKQKYRSDKYQSPQPRTREYHDKNSYTLINSEYEKEVKEDEKPSTRYRSVAEFGREAPSSVKQSNHRSYKDKGYGQHSLKSSPGENKEQSKDFDNDKESKGGRNGRGETDSTTSQRSLRSQKRSESTSLSDRSRYRPGYHSYSSALADEYRKKGDDNDKQTINRGLFSGTDDRQSRKRSEKSLGSERDMWSDRGRKQKVQTTTQGPRPSAKSLSSDKRAGDLNDEEPWNFAHEFMTQPEEVETDPKESDQQSSRWQRYKTTLDAKDSGKLKPRDASTWYIKEPGNNAREMVSNSQAEKRREKQGLYDHRWFF